MKSSKKKTEKEELIEQEIVEEAPAEEKEPEPEFKYTLDIPEDEIWTYQIEGLPAPHIGKPFKNAKRNKTLVVFILVITILASIALSLGIVSSKLYTYKDNSDGTVRLERFSNNGSYEEVTVDYKVINMKTEEKDMSIPVTEIGEYAFNCDEVIKRIYIGKDVRYIDSKAFYSCWNLEYIDVDDENPVYCDIDGVLYKYAEGTKTVEEIVFYPTNYDKTLRYNYGYNVPVLTLKAGADSIDDDGVLYNKRGYRCGEVNIAEGKTIADYVIVDTDGKPIDKYPRDYLYSSKTLFEEDGRIMEELWGTTGKYNEAFFQQYNRDVRTYVIPSTVTKIGELAFAYSNIFTLYIPEGVTVMDNMAIFKNTVLMNIYSYTTDEEVNDTTYNATASMKDIYPSLPEGLEMIGSDCMYYTRGLNYMYIPSSVKQISHHAFWDAVYKEKDGSFTGIGAVDIAADESTFNSECNIGENWAPKYDYMLFNKTVDLHYGAERKSYEESYKFNVHHQYYWAVQWVINNKSEAVKNASSYLVRDLDNDGTPELILRIYDEATQQINEEIYTFKYGYLYEYDGEADFEGAKFSPLTDNAQLDTIK